MALNSLGLGFLFRATDEASPVMKGVSSNLDKTARASAAAAKVMNELGSGFQRVSAVSTIAGTAISGALGLAVHQSAKFQFGVAQVVTEADKAKLPAAEIARIAKEMATTYGGDLDTQVKALYQGVAAGADDAAKAVALLNGANQLAIAGNTSQETALLGITKVLNNYGLSFDKATDVADAFFVAVKGGQTTVAELGDGIGQVASLAKNAGLSMEELIGSLGTAATLTKDTASSTASLKAVLSGIAHPTAEAAAEAAKLGIKFDSTTLRSMGLVKFLNQITSSSKYSADSMNHLFGSMEAAGFMSALAANNSAQLSGMMDGMSKKAGGAAEAFKTMSETLEQQGAIMKANVMVALVSLGDAIVPAITMLTKGVSAIVKAFNGLPEPVKKGLAIVLAVTAGALLLAGAIAGIVAAAITAEVPLLAVAAAVGTVFQAMIPLILIGGLVVAAIVAIKRAFDENVGGLRDTVLPIVKKLELAWQALSQAFSQGGFSGAVREELNKAENAGIKNFVVNLYSWFSRIENFFKGLAKGFSAAGDAAGPTFAKFSIAIEKLVAAFGRLFGGKQDPAKAAETFDKFGSAGERVGAILERVAEVVVSGLTFAMETGASFIDTIREFEPSFMRVWESAKQLWGVLGDLFGAVGQLAAAFGLGGGSADSTGSKFAVFVGILAELLSIGIKVTTFLVGALTGAFLVVATVVGFVRDMVVAALTSIIDAIFNVLGILSKVSDKVAGIFGKDMGLSKMNEDLRNSVLGRSGPTGGPGFSVGAAAVPNTPVASPTQLALPSTTLASASAPAAASATLQAQAASGPGGGAAGSSPEQIGAAVASAMKQAPPPQAGPVTIPVFLDGDKIGEAMANRSSSNATRSYQPGPMPTG